MKKKSQKIKDFCLVGDGTHSSIQRQDYGIPYYTSKNFKSDGLDLSKLDFISEADYEKHFIGKNALVQPLEKDIVFGIIGSIGTPYLVKKGDFFGISSSVAILRSKGDICPEYLYHYMCSNTFQSSIDSMKSGSAQGFLSLELIKNLPIIVPTLKIQKKIAAILSAYDDLIENNKKRIQILENMAEELYKEWFVRFRFPNYENAEFEKGVPKDWSYTTLECLGKIRTGKTPSTSNSEFYGGEYPFYKTPDMHDKVFVFETDETLTEQGLYSQKSQIIEANAIMVTCIGSGGATAISTKKGCTNQQINSLSVANNKFLYWAYYLIKYLKPQIELYGATGATMTNLSKGKFSNLEIVKPTDALIERYFNLVSPKFEMIKKLTQMNQVLEEQKNSLLPRLISGKLSVEDLDIQFPPSMQDQ